MNEPASLSALFHAHAPAGAHEDTPDLEALLRGLFEAGRRAWPTIAVGPEPFVRQLAARGAAGALEHVRAAELYLACACAARAPRAIEAFDRVHLSRVGAFLARLLPPPTPDEVDEVRQILREKLFVGLGTTASRIVDYDGRHALESWLRVIAVRAAIDRRRRSPAMDEYHDDADQRSSSPESEPEVQLVHERYREPFKQAVRDAVGALAAEHHEVLRLRFVEGRTMDQLAAALGVHRATAHRRVNIACEAVLEHARRLLEERLGLSEGELDSLAGVMQSQLDVSLFRLLKQRGA